MLQSAAIMDLTGYITASDAAAMLGVSRARVHALCKSGRLRFLQVDPRRRMVLHADVLAELGRRLGLDTHHEHT